jgi:hypothetical protein
MHSLPNSPFARPVFHEEAPEGAHHQCMGEPAGDAGPRFRFHAGSIRENSDGVKENRGTTFSTYFHKEKQHPEGAVPLFNAVLCFLEVWDNVPADV